MADRPHLAAAFLCERILEDKDGTLSAIRIVDTFTVQKPPGLPEGAKHTIEFTVLIAFKKATLDDNTEEHEFELQVHTPTNAKVELQPTSTKVKFILNQQGSGANLRLNLGLELKEYGLFWFDVIVDGEMLTRIPFKLIEQTVSAPAAH